MCDNNPTPSYGGPTTSAIQPGQRTKSISSQRIRNSVSKPTPSGIANSPIKICSNTSASSNPKKSPVKPDAAVKTCTGAAINPINVSSSTNGSSNSKRSPVKPEAAGKTCTGTAVNPVKVSSSSGEHSNSTRKSTACTGPTACDDTTNAPTCAGMTACLGSTANPIKINSSSGNGNSSSSFKEEETCCPAANPITAACTGKNKATKPRSGAVARPSKSQRPKSTNPSTTTTTAAVPGKVIKRGAARGLCVPVKSVGPRSARSRTPPVRFGVDEHVEITTVKKTKAVKKAAAPGGTKKTSADVKKTGAGVKKTGVGAKKTGAGAKKTGAGVKKTGAGVKKAKTKAKASTGAKGRKAQTKK